MSTEPEEQEDLPLLVEVDEDTGEVTVSLVIGDDVMECTADSIEAAAFILGVSYAKQRGDDVVIEDA
jgi:hypothetical protein